MKRLVLAIFVAAALISGCNRIEIEGDGTKPIKFGAASTRAEVTSANDILAFKVFAEMNLGADNAEDGSDKQWIPLLENERVYRDNSDADFTYDNTRYWVNDRTFYFFGFYPETINVTRYGLESGWAYTSTIEVPYAADLDFITAIYSQGITDNSFPESVPMQFVHRFARVKFNIKKAENNKEDKFTVTEIGFSGISRSATFALMYRQGQQYEPILTPNSENRTVNRRNLNKPIEAAGTDLLGNNGLLLLPQTIVAGQATLNISFQYQQAEDTDGTAIENQTLSKALPAVVWEANKTYVYNLELKDDKNIYISTPTVEGWGTSQPGGFIIVQ